jgi:hypothetical protein
VAQITYAASDASAPLALFSSASHPDSTLDPNTLLDHLPWPLVIQLTDMSDAPTATRIGHAKYPR